jgi:hypothetical protein
MAARVQLKIAAPVYMQFLNLKNEINAHPHPAMTQALGNTLADIACAMVDQVFGELAQAAHATQQNYESEQTIEQIRGVIRKHLPWALGLFKPERLTPMVNYLYDMTRVEGGQPYLSYPIDPALAHAFLDHQQQVNAGQVDAIPLAFKTLTQIVDCGVTHLLHEPKKMLNFNFMVDKSLSGVIHLTTQMAYKRLEKVGQQLALPAAQHYLQHFAAFILLDHTGSAHETG